MEHEDLTTLSQAQLIHIVLQQRVALANLNAKLAQQARVEPRLDAHPCRDERHNTGHERRKLGSGVEDIVRAAVHHVDDTTYLSQSPLAEILTSAEGTRLQGIVLQQLLYSAITRLQTSEVRRGRSWRACQVLYLRYVERKTIREIARDLSISMRQYFRDQEQAIEMLTRLLMSD